jgi:hypothetical protein
MSHGLRFVRVRVRLSSSSLRSSIIITAVVFVGRHLLERGKEIGRGE